MATEAARPDIATGSAVALLGRVAGVLALMGVAVVTSRVLGPEGRGQFVTATIFISLLAAGSTGLTAAAAHHLSKRRLRPVQVLANGSVAGTMFALTAMIIAAAAAAVLEGYAQTTSILIALAAVPLALRAVVNGLFLGRAEVAKYSLAFYGPTVISLLAMLVVLVGFGVDDATVALAIWVAGFGAALVLILPLVVGTTGFPGVPHLDRAVQSSISRFAVTSGVYGLIALANSRVDVLVLQWLKGSHMTGIYSAAISPSEGILFFGNAIAVATVAEIGRRRPEDAAELTARAVRTTLIIGVPIVGMTLLAADPLVHVLFGEEFSQAARQLRIVVVAMLLLMPTVILGNYFAQQLGRPRYTVWVGSLSLFVAFALSLGLIPEFGLTGAAVARLLAFASSLVAASYLFLRASKLSVRQYCVIRRQDFLAFARLGRRILYGTKLW